MIESSGRVDGAHASVYVVATVPAAKEIERALFANGVREAVIRTAELSQGAGVLAQVAAVPVDILILDLEAVAGNVAAVAQYRAQRDKARIILYAPDRQPGDGDVAAIVGLGIYDVATTVDEVPGLMERPSAFPAAMRWMRAVPDALRGRGDGPAIETRALYLHSPMILVWGHRRTSTVLNLAVAAARHGIDALGINLDWERPILDHWIGAEKSPGPMSLAQEMRPEYAPKMLIEKWGARWLPAGDRLENIGTPDLLESMGPRAQPLLEETLLTVYRRAAGNRPTLTLMDAGRSFEDLPTLAGLRQSSHVLLVSSGGPIRDEELAIQAGWLCRIHLAEPEKLLFVGQPGGPDQMEVEYKRPGTDRMTRFRLEAVATLPDDKDVYRVSETKRTPEALYAGAWDEVLQGVLGVAIGDERPVPTRKRGLFSGLFNR